MDPRIDGFRQALDAGRTRPFHYGLVALICLLLVADGYDTQAIGYVAPALVKAWGVKRAAFAPVFSLGLFGVMIGALAEHGVGAQTIEGLTGVWTDGPPPAPGLAGAAKKIGSIGVHVSKGITTHGLAVNVDNDLQPFEWVIPCGIEGVSMTSIAREGGREASVGAYGETVARHFGEVFEREPQAVSAAELGLEAAPATVGGER